MKILLPLALLLASATPATSKPADGARAQANLASYFSDDDYPVEAQRNEEEGIVAFSLSVGPQGQVTGCQVTISSGSKSLDEATCRILSTRARFSPARDSKGRAVADVMTGRIKWALPKDPQFEPDNYAFGATIDQSGAASGCYFFVRSDDGLTKRADGPCPEPTSPLLKSSRQLSKRASSEVRAEQLVLRDPAKTLPEQPADRLVSRTIIRAKVDADGYLKDCQLLESKGSLLNPAPCGSERRLTPDPAGKEIEVRIVNSLYLIGEASDEGGGQPGQSATRHP